MAVLLGGHMIYPNNELSIEEYHASPRLSHSKLQTLARQGPRAFAARHVTRKQARTPPSEAMLFGQCFEDLVYGLPINERYLVKPDKMSFATKEGKVWKAEAEASGKPIISQGDLDAMADMRASLAENETAMRMIAACRVQTSYTCDYAGTPGLQSRPDWDCLEGSIDSGFLPYSLDLKSTISLNKLASGRGVAEYGYHSQAAIANWTMERNGIGRVRTFLLAVEKTAPYRSQIIEINPDWLTVGWDWCGRQLEKLRGHYKTNDWPRVDREVISLPPVPGWLGLASREHEDDV